MAIYTFLVLSHVIGTVLGVGGATFAEILYQEAARDNKINEAENALLRKTYPVLRLGMILLVLSGFGLLFLYRINGAMSELYDPRLWAKLTIVSVIIVNAIGMQARKFPMWLATAVSFTSWWAALVLGVWRNIDTSYLTIMVYYIIAVAITTVILDKLRNMRKMNPRKIKK